MIVNRYIHVRVYGILLRLLSRIGLGIYTKIIGGLRRHGYLLLCDRGFLLLR